MDRASGPGVVDPAAGFVHCDAAKMLPGKRVQLCGQKAYARRSPVPERGPYATHPNGRPYRPGRPDRLKYASQAVATSRVSFWRSASFCGRSRIGRQSSALDAVVPRRSTKIELVAKRVELHIWLTHAANARLPSRSRTRGHDRNSACNPLSKSAKSCAVGWPVYKRRASCTQS